jgi:hypothetical protein
MYSLRFSKLIVLKEYKIEDVRHIVLPEIIQSPEKITYDKGTAIT